MKVLPNIYLVGSGRNGIFITDDWDCTVWLLDGGSEMALIDCGAGRNIDLILDEIRRDGLDPERITKVLLTHSHADHAGGAAAFRERLGAAIYIARAGAEDLRTGNEDAVGLTVARSSDYYPQDYRLTPCEVDVELQDGDVVQVGSYELTVLETPGHSQDSICFHGYVDDRNVLWCGDVVQFGDGGQFKGMISLIHAPGCSIEDYGRGAKRLAGVPVDALLPGHRLFYLTQGQRQVDAVVQAFEGMPLPKNVLQLF